MEDLKRLSLIYSSSCPNYEPVKRMLEGIGLAFKKINQDNLHDGYFDKNFLSPTLLSIDCMVFQSFLHDRGM